MLLKKKVFSLGCVILPLIIGSGVFLFTRPIEDVTSTHEKSRSSPLSNRLRLNRSATRHLHRKDDAGSGKVYNQGKDFLYLVQAESCLPQHLSDREQLGNGNSKDVIVLAWKTKCREENVARLPHVTYLFDSNRTWGSGRNLLFEKALERYTNNYLYYIFLDEDIELSFTTNITADNVYNSSTNNHPIETFESFLRGLEPAVGLVNFCSRCGRLLANSSYVPALCCSPRPRRASTPLVLPVSISFDAAFNAFHRDAIKYLLPYKLNYENSSWWESQKYVILASDILFRGQVLRYNGVTALNTEHRKYPKQQLDNWGNILMDIKTKLPARYHNLNVFHQEPIPQLPFNVTNNVLFTPRWNVSLGMTKLPIIPLAHFGRNQTGAGAISEKGEVL